jgi:hypothetical protein
MYRKYIFIIITRKQNYSSRDTIPLTHMDLLLPRMMMQVARNMRMEGMPKARE